MAVLKVEVASVIGRMEDLDKVTELCGRSGFFHPENALSFYSDTSGFSPLREESPYSEPLQMLTGAFAAANKKPKLLKPGRVGKLGADANEIRAYAKSVADAFSELAARRADAEEKVRKYSRQIEEIGHFVGLELDLDEIHACRYIKVRFGSLPKESYEKLQAYTQNPYVVFFPSTASETHYWGVYFAPIDAVGEVDRIFSSLYFVRTYLGDFTGSPESAVKALQEKADRETERIRAADREADRLWEENHDEYQKVYSWLTAQSAYFGIRRYAARYDGNFILAGWIPAEKEAAFRNAVSRVESAECTFEAGAEELTHSPPVRLRNRKLFRPFEFFVDMYGLPSYDEVDPTPFVALTYMILFGIMFGDLGQGLVLSLVGWLVWKKKRMPLGKILIPCGISSAVFGTLFGSVFGFENALDPLYRNLFGLPGKPIEVMEPQTINGIILSAVGIGVALVLIAILINISSSLRRKHYENALFGPNGLAGLIFYASLVGGFGGQFLLGIHIVTPAYAVCLIFLPLAAMYFREVLGKLAARDPNWKPESWGGYLMQNFFEVFEFLLSFASNTMSFLRVGAFVLVHAGMMMVVFTLAGMTGGAGSAVIVVIGNAFVMVLESLLVGIQVLRLEFYEMFSRFFDGEGRAFHPVVIGAQNTAA